MFLRLLNTLWPSARWLPKPLGRLRATNPATHKLDLFLVSLFLYLFITALALTLFRLQSASDTDTLFRSRYKINGVLFMVAAYLSFLTLWPQRSVRFVFPVWVLLTLGLNVYAVYWTSVPIQYDRDRYNVSSFNYRYNGYWYTFPEAMWFEQFAKEKSDLLMPLGLYQFPAVFYTPFEKTMLLKPVGAIARPDSIPLKVSESGPEFMLTNQTAGPVRGGRDGQCMVLKSNQRTYLFAVIPHLNSRKAWLTTGQPFGPGFTAHIAKAVLAAGTYRIGLFRYVDGQARLTYLPYELIKR